MDMHAATVYQRTTEKQMKKKTIKEMITFNSHRRDSQVVSILRNTLLCRISIVEYLNSPPNFSV